MRVHSYLITAFAFLTACVLSAVHAAPITYTLTGTMSGDFSINLASFTDKAFTWTITGDTTQRQTLASGLSAVRAQTSSLDIADVGSSIMPDDQLFAVAGAPHFSTFAFTVSDGMDGIGFTAPELASYDGVSAIGPISVALNGTFFLPTRHGEILFIAEAKNMVFQAVTVPGVPEPLTLTLFGAGLAGIGALRRRHKAIA